MGLTKFIAQPYAVERERITSALACFPNLTSISILRQTDPARNHAPTWMVREILIWIARHLSRLQYMRIDYDGYPLDHFAHLPSLRTLQLSGFSDTAPKHAQQSLRSLMNLQELHIIPAGYIMRRPYFKCQQPKQSVTAALIQNLKPLRVLTLCEPPERQANSEAFLTPLMMKAVGSAHGQSLVELRICSLHALSGATLSMLSALLTTATRLRALGLTFPDMLVDLLDALPETVILLELLVRDAVEALIMLDRLNALPSTSLQRRRVKFLTASSAINATGLASTKLPICQVEEMCHVSRRAHSDWTVSWGVWRPFSDA
ncbi:uncharacterized protein HMPREF1541_01923 [Cyphellophora europaea CBS 101466]|uniref:F-box domain-containing protein n=1 Tax=Cyphellophora europaea (strain CBS 101466) TaxID=1220924 RepID=W2S2E7_CYPE1|nr:uncharacterized protein HMPREF1541_01923 [Cyphellophora europaea CBS 101466]ETN42765.1 hypothetical protein HMPREF1541_01923 [Cyphellophora europaea CBS 101466]